MPDKRVKGEIAETLRDRMAISNCHEMGLTSRLKPAPSVLPIQHSANTATKHDFPVPDLAYTSQTNMRNNRNYLYVLFRKIILRSKISSPVVFPLRQWPKTRPETQMWEFTLVKFGKKGGETTDAAAAGWDTTSLWQDFPLAQIF